jgi:O-antigen/teichoic acid export membrane protein
MGIPESVIYFIIPAVTMAVLDGIFMQVFLPRRSSKLIRNFSIAQTIVGFLISVSFVYWMFENKLSKRYLGRLWADVALFVVFGGLKIYQISKYVKLRIDRKHIKYITNYSIPIIPYLLSGQILSLADRLFIEKYHGMTQSGLYSFAYNISMLQIPISNALYNAFVPDYFKYYNEERYQEHDVAVTQLYKIISLSAVFLILFGYEIGKILGSQSYSASLFIIPIVIIGHWLNAIFPIYSRNFQFKKRTFVAAWVTLSAAIVNIILNILFIPKYGNIAAAYNTTISFLFLSLTGYFVSKYVVKIHTLNPIHLLKPFVVMIITAVVFYTYFIPHAQYFILNILLKLIFVMFAVDILYLNYINKFISRIIKSN